MAYLLAKGIVSKSLSFSVYSKSGLHLAAQFGHSAIMAYLLAKGMVSKNLSLMPFSIQ